MPSTISKGRIANVYVYVSILVASLVHVEFIISRIVRSQKVYFMEFF